ncbi:MAG: Hsp70 family protein [Sphingomonadales bacterium]|nr:Hsp70 family protein [Sphingomonadales bacterium]
MNIGIDLGTTASSVALWREGWAELVPNALGELRTPTAVSIEADGAVHVGAAALDLMAAAPDRTAAGFKRLIGSGAGVVLGGRRFAAEELAALVLRGLRDDVRVHAGVEPTGAVIAVPACFDARQRAATRRAGELAGFSSVRLIGEPAATALAYAWPDKGGRAPFLVFDLGGGTFDVAVAELGDGGIRLRAAAGDGRLGGNDFDARLAAMMADRIDLEGHLDELDECRRTALLSRAATRARLALSQAASAEFAVTLDDARLKVTLSEDEFEGATADLVQRLREPVERALRDAGLDRAGLGAIVVVGGATRMPVVRRAITRLFGQFPDSGCDPESSVARGAAIHAALLARDEVRIFDVCPHALGVETAEADGYGNVQPGVFSPIIGRNAPVPTSRVKTYRTTGDGQPWIEMDIYQGEARDVVGNVRLGTLTVPVPPRPAGEVTVDVRFSFDDGGLLAIDYTIPSAGVTRQPVELAPAQDEGARGDGLAGLTFPAREAAGHVALMARAERVHGEFVGNERSFLGTLIGRFLGALSARDPREIASAQVALSISLDALEACPAG